jgi:hypothetical protein
MTDVDRYYCYRCAMTFLRECPIKKVRPDQRLICPDCGIIFGATGFDGKRPIVCWLIRLSDVSSIQGVTKIA